MNASNETSIVGLLLDKYGHWGSHPTYTVADWQHEVSNDYTRRGYWEWVAKKIELEGEK